MKVRNRTLVALASIFIVTALASLSGCGLDDALTGTSWDLTVWSVSSLDPTGFSITIAFNDGQVSGHSAVNTYGGPYTLGLGNAISFGPLAMTEMAGPEPAMRAESVFLTLLQQVATYRSSGDSLTMLDKGGNELLIFRRASK